MYSVALALACLFSLGHGRRLQTSIVQTQNTSTALATSRTQLTAFDNASASQVPCTWRHLRRLARIGVIPAQTLAALLFTARLPAGFNFCSLEATQRQLLKRHRLRVQHRWSQLRMQMLEDDLMAMKVPELKAKLKEVGLKVSGSKAELVDRLREHFAANALTAFSEPAPSSRSEDDDLVSPPASSTEDAPDVASLPASSTEGAADLVSLTIKELKKRLKAAGLPVGGAKAELIARLEEQAELEAHAKAREVPTEAEEALADAEEVPAEAEEAPADTEEVSAQVEEVPATEEEAPAKDEKVAALGEELARLRAENEALRLQEELAIARAENEALKRKQEALKAQAPPVEAPAPAETPVPVQAPVEVAAPVRGPRAGAPVEVPVEAAAPVEAPAAAPVEAPAAPVRGPEVAAPERGPQAGAPVEAPVAAPVEAAEPAPAPQPFQKKTFESKEEEEEEMNRIWDSILAKLDKRIEEKKQREAKRAGTVMAEEPSQVQMAVEPQPQVEMAVENVIEETTERSDDGDLASLKVPDLRAKLKDLGLKASGTKTELVERLQEHAGR